MHFIERQRSVKYEILTGKDFSPVAVSMVRTGKEKTAFFCSSDVYALELLKYFRETGISVPRDAGLMGFDNQDILAFINPRITTVSTSIEEAGKQAMETLLKLIAGEKVEKTNYVPFQICPGDTI
jgi:LacI family transcriptional regulator